MKSETQVTSFVFSFGDVKNLENAVLESPESAEIHYQLAEDYYNKHKLQEAIIYYRKANLLKEKKSASLHFEVGKIQEEQGQLERAIESYCLAVKFDPENFTYFHRLGETLARVNQPQQWEKAIALYQKIITLKPDLVWGHHFLGDALRHNQQWKDAIHAYRCAITLEPNFFWSYLFLGDGLKQLEEWEEAIVIYENAQQINPNSIELQKNLLESYCELGLISLKQNNIEFAKKLYQKGLKINHNRDKSYGNFYNLLAQSFYEKGIQEVQQELFSEAIGCFQEVADLSSDINRYEYLWNGLNDMGPLDKSSLYCQNDIDKDAVFSFFSKKDSSKILVLDSLSKEDCAFLNQAGLSLPVLELIRQDEQRLEEIYINKFISESEQPFRVSKLSTRTSNYHSGAYHFPPCHFQQSIIETGYIYSLCPFTGQILRSNQSFFIVDSGTPNYHFRFVGKEVFYVMVDYNVRLNIYIPKLDLILVLRSADRHRGFNFQHFVNSLKSNLVTAWKEVKLYLSKNNKKTVGVWGVLPSLGHYLWNELTGIKYLLDNEILAKAECLVIGSYEYFNVGDTFPEVSEDRIVRFDNQTLFTDMLNNNYFGTMVTEIPITEELIDRVYQGALKKCSESCLKEVRAAKQHFPLIWVAIRTNVRRWLSQLEGTANIITELSQEYPNMAVVFDGWSRTEKEDSHSEMMIAKEREFVQQIESLIPQNITTYNIVGAMTYEKVAWSKAIDTYIVTLGSPTTYTTWIGNKPGVAHGNKFFYGDWLKDHLLAREQVVMPVFVPIEYVEHQGDGIMCNYDFDWRLIYNEVVKLLKNINPER